MTYLNSSNSRRVNNYTGVTVNELHWTQVLHTAEKYARKKQRLMDDKAKKRLESVDKENFGKVDCYMSQTLCGDVT